MCNIRTFLLLFKFIIEFGEQCKIDPETTCIDEGLRTRCVTSCLDPLPWQAAEEECKKQGGGLVTVDNQKVYQITVKLVSDSGRPAWLGARTRRVNMTWFYSKMDTRNFNNWAPGHPKNISGNSDCLVTDSTYQWKDTSCEDWRKFVCVKIDGRNWDIIPESLNSQLQKATTWRNAVLECYKLQSQLLEVSSQEQLDKLMSLNLQFELIWLSATRLQWVWATAGSLLHTDHWMNFTESIPETDQCLLQTKSDVQKGWKAAPCQEKHPFICQHVSERATLQSTTLQTVKSPHSSSVPTILAVLISIGILAVIIISIIILRRRYCIKISAPINKSSHSVSDDEELSYYSGPGGVYCGPHSETSLVQVGKPSDVSPDKGTGIDNKTSRCSESYRQNSERRSDTDSTRISDAAAEIYAVPNKSRKKNLERSSSAYHAYV